MSPLVFIALGSNIDPERNLEAAAKMLRERWPSIRFSSVYKTKAREREDQGDFLNAVGVFSENEKPEKILLTLQEIEHTLKKNPPYRFGPRTIDLDLLLYGEEIIQSDLLTVPHPRMHERRFVLEPLCELANVTSLHPILGKTWKELLSQRMNQECESTQINL